MVGIVDIPTFSRCLNRAGACMSYTVDRLLCALALAFALLPVLPPAAAAQSVALSFDDGFDPREQPLAAAWNGAILDALEAAGVQAILFPTGRRVDSDEGLRLVGDWGRAGHAIGNHTYAHRNFGAAAMTVEVFTADIGKAQALLQGLPGWTPRLRFPYLKEGETPEKRDALRAWLREQGYGSGAVSIDASDWYYNSRFLEWRGQHPTDDPAAWRAAYLDHLWDRACYYDSLSVAVLGRSLPHVLLLHANAINAAFLPDVIAKFRERGWKLVSPAEAWADPAYQLGPQTLPAGESHLWALARERGLPGLRYPAESDEYEKERVDRLVAAGD